jgi:KEOPS complex subunit Cgi121
MNLQIEIFIIEGSVYAGSLKDFFKKINIENCEVAILNADYVAGREHAEFAAKKAIKSWFKGKKVARTLPMEILLYASATRQINRALEMGIKENRNNRVVAVIVGSKSCVEKFKNSTGFREENVLEMTEEKIENLKRFFDIKDEEIEVTGEGKIPEIIRERIVIYDILK